MTKLYMMHISSEYAPKNKLQAAALDMMPAMRHKNYRVVVSEVFTVYFYEIEAMTGIAPKVFRSLRRNSANMSGMLERLKDANHE